VGGWVGGWVGGGFGRGCFAARGFGAGRQRAQEQRCRVQAIPRTQVRMARSAAANPLARSASGRGCLTALVHAHDALVHTCSCSCLWDLVDARVYALVFAAGQERPDREKMINNLGNIIISRGKRWHLHLRRQWHHRLLWSANIPLCNVGTSKLSFELYSTFMNNWNQVAFSCPLSANCFRWVKWAWNRPFNHGESWKLFFYELASILQLTEVRWK